jgi:hypothetical protein
MPFPLGLQLFSVKPQPKLFIKCVEPKEYIPKKNVSKNKKRRKNKSYKK